MPSFERRWLMLSVVCGMALPACTDYPHTNPFDPQTTVELKLVGPDTLDLAVGESFNLAVVSTPAFAHEAPHWETNSLQHGITLAFPQSGTFTLQRFSHADTTPVSVTFRADLSARRSATKDVVFVSRIVGISVSFCDGGELRSAFAGAAVDACPIVIDKSRAGFSAISTSASVTIRNSAVAQQVSGAPYRFSFVAPGSTYIVFTTRGYTDSVRVIVNPRN
jgi:hypothetical protein